MFVSLRLTFKTLLNASAVFIIASISQFAYAYDAKDKQVITQKVQTISESIEQQSFEPVIMMMPPKVLATLSSQANLSVEALQNKLIAQSNVMMKRLTQQGAKIHYVANLEQAQQYVSSTGRDYLLIPTHMRINMTDNEFDMQGTLLAIEDGNSWYLMRIDNAQHLKILNRAYTDMVNVQLPDPKVKLN